MLPKDKQLIWKLKRRISILIFIIFGLFYWIRISHLDMEYSDSQVQSLTMDLIEKESQINKLQSKLDSLRKPVLIKKPEKVDFKINKIKVNIKKDSTILIPKHDTIIQDEMDSISM